MRKIIARTIIALTILSAVSRDEPRPVAGLIRFMVGLALYPGVLLLVLMVFAARFALPMLAYIAWRSYRDGHLPAWLLKRIPPRPSPCSVPFSTRSWPTPSARHSTGDVAPSTEPNPPGPAPATDPAPPHNGDATAAAAPGLHAQHAARLVSQIAHAHLN